MSRAEEGARAKKSNGDPCYDPTFSSLLRCSRPSERTRNSPVRLMDQAAVLATESCGVRKYGEQRALIHERDGKPSKAGLYLPKRNETAKTHQERTGKRRTR